MKTPEEMRAVVQTGGWRGGDLQSSKGIIVQQMETVLDTRERKLVLAWLCGESPMHQLSMRDVPENRVQGIKNWMSFQKIGDEWTTQPDWENELRLVALEAEAVYNRDQGIEQSKLEIGGMADIAVRELGGEVGKVTKNATVSTSRSETGVFPVIEKDTYFD